MAVPYGIGVCIGNINLNDISLNGNVDVFARGGLHTTHCYINYGCFP